MNKFLGYEKTQNVDAFSLHKILKFGKIALRYTTRSATGFGVGYFRPTKNIGSIRLQIYKLTVFLRKES